MISIIVPVYNVAAYLPQCLDSLTGQTYRDIEIICVNDGSTDESLTVLEEYAKRDERVKVISRENKGISASRNEALAVACGEWVMFVDSDDWVDADACLTALQAAERNRADLVMWAYTREYAERSLPKLYFPERRVWNEADIASLHRRIVGPVGEELSRPDTLDACGTIWAKLYRRQLIEQGQPVRFVDTRAVGSAEDVLFNIDYLGRARRAVYLPRPMYHYRKDGGSFTSVHKADLPRQWDTLYAEIQARLQAQNVYAAFEEAYHNRIALGIIGLGLNEVFANCSFASKRANISRLLRRPVYRQAVCRLRLGCLPLHWRVFFLCAKHGFAAGLLAMLTVIKTIIYRRGTLLSPTRGVVLGDKSVAPPKRLRAGSHNKNHNKKMRIVYCMNSIRYLGGIQRVTIVKANALADVPGNEVFIIVTDNKDGLIVEPLSAKVHLVDLDVNYYADDWKSKWHVLKGIFVKRREHKKRLARELRRIKPDIVVSVGQAEKNMLADIRGSWATVRELHFNKNYRRLAARSAFAKLLAVCGDIYDYHWKIKAYDQIVVLTDEDRETNWGGNSRVTTIPNPASFTTDKAAKLESKTVISTGRLQAQKNYVSLIRAFRLVADRHADWTLEIYGDGADRNMLQNEITRLGLANNVMLKGYTANVREQMLGSSLYVLSSLFEGFPLVLIEAMSCGLPVVSYACPCGPKDIITDGKDGFIVPVNDEAALADRICRLIEDADMRRQMGEAAKEKARRYAIENIVPQWMRLFDGLVMERMVCRN